MWEDFRLYTLLSYTFLSMEAAEHLHKRLRLRLPIMHFYMKNDPEYT